MTDDRVLRHDIDHVKRDRLATDDSLKSERSEADTLIDTTVARQTGDRLNRQRRETEERLTDSIERVRNAGADLPEVAETLVDAADMLSEAADGLGRAAQKLTDATDPEAVATLHHVATTLDKTADTVGGEPRDIDVARPESADEAHPVVADTLASVAESLGVVAATLAEERKQTDSAMQEERAFIDETLADERKAADTAIEEERDAWRHLLSAERQATDEDLARERADTDRAVEQAIDLLKHEQDEHDRTRDVVVTREELLAIVSHDLRTPLNVISLSAALLADDMPRANRSARTVKWIDDIRRAANLMSRMLSDLLDGTRFEEGRFRLSAETRDAVGVVRECAAQFDALARAHDVTIRVDVPATPVAVVAHFDHDRILQVLSNLVRNALQFTPAGGLIALRVTAEADGCRIAVSDTGPGIPAADRERIFERFHRSESADRTGLGLGLYISKAIVEAHGGRIWADGEVGHGSTFSFTLPCSVRL